MLLNLLLDYLEEPLNFMCTQVTIKVSVYTKEHVSYRKPYADIYGKLLVPR